MGAGQGWAAKAVTLPVVWIEEAVHEYYEAIRWYADVGPSLSIRFARAVENRISQIAEYPFRFPIVSENRRRAGIQRFPHGLFYSVEDTRIVVIACFHGKRDPHQWQSR
jgi:toxin ParE1/3/4